MVEGRVTDGKRIAALLASELTGLALGPLEDIEVVDADPDLTLTEEGTLAYRIVDSGTRVGSVTVYPDHAVVSLEMGPIDIGDNHPWDSLTSIESLDDSTEFRVKTGRSVKPAVDAIALVVDET